MMGHNLLNADLDVFDSTRAVWVDGDKKIFPLDIKHALEKIGLKKGDIVMSHFDLGVIGKLGDIKDGDEFFNTVINTILAVVGSDGALIVPAFSYSFCRNEVFDIAHTVPTLGRMAQVAFKRYKENQGMALRLPIFRSQDPVFSCIGFGRQAGSICNDLGTSCFGENSVFGRLYRHDAKLMGFGFQFAPTYMHFPEQRFHEQKKPLSYRFMKAFKGRIIDAAGNSGDAEYTYFVRDVGRCVYDLKRLPLELERRSLLNKAALGAGTITLATARDVHDTIFDMLDKDEFALLEQGRNSSL